MRSVWSVGRVQVFLAVVLAGLLPAGAQGDILWDNNIVPDGLNGYEVGRPTWNPIVRTADNFDVPAGGWQIDGFKANGVHTSGWVDSGAMEIMIYNKDGGTGAPGTIFAQFPAVSYSTTYVGTIFGMPDYEYSAPFSLTIPQGEYFISWFEHSQVGGAGQHLWWATSDGGEHNDTPAWVRQELPGEVWNHLGSDVAFVITGVPEPMTLTLLALGGVALLLRRRR